MIPKKKKAKVSNKIGLKGRSKLTKAKWDVLFNSFVNDLNATQASNMAGVNRNTANLYYGFFREDILEARKYPPRLSGEIEMDQAFFGARRRRKYSDDGKIISDSKENKIIVFGIIKRKGDVYTQIIKRMDKRVLIPIVHMVVAPKSHIYTDEWRSFNKLKDSGYKHFIINHSKRFSDGKGVHTNTIENFWSFAKRRLCKFNGLFRDTFILHLKECEFRYVNRKDLAKALKAIVRERN